MDAGAMLKSIGKAVNNQHSQHKFTQAQLVRFEEQQAQE
jgi:hypothetical protein